MKIKKIILLVISIIAMFISIILGYSLVEYYDLESIVYIGIPLLAIIRFSDLYIRDFISDIRHKQRLIATFVTTLVLIAFLIVGYIIFKTLNSPDIYKFIIETFKISGLMQYVK